MFDKIFFTWALFFIPAWLYDILDIKMGKEWRWWGFGVFVVFV